MKRLKPSSPDSGKKAAGRAGGARLLERAPLVYVGPEALGAIRGAKGLLMGSKRPDWVDVLAFEPHTEAKVSGLVNLRFDLKPVDYDVVGIVLSGKELVRHQNMLIRELVPGDIILILEAGDKASDARGFVHLGDELDVVRLKLSRAISVRSHLPRA